MCNFSDLTEMSGNVYMHNIYRFYLGIIISCQRIEELLRSYLQNVQSPKTEWKDSLARPRIEWVDIIASTIMSCAMAG